MPAGTDTTLGKREKEKGRDGEEGEGRRGRSKEREKEGEGRREGRRGGEGEEGEGEGVERGRQGGYEGGRIRRNSSSHICWLKRSLPNTYSHPLLLRVERSLFCSHKLVS